MCDSDLDMLGRIGFWPQQEKKTLIICRLFEERYLFVMVVFKAASTYKWTHLLIRMLIVKACLKTEIYGSTLECKWNIIGQNAS